jgi:hypothetical protein
MACNLTDAIAHVQVLTRFHVNVEEERYLPCFESTDMYMYDHVEMYTTSHNATANTKPLTSLPIAMCAINLKLVMSGLKVRPAHLYLPQPTTHPTEHATSYDTRSM